MVKVNRSRWVSLITLVLLVNFSFVTQASSTSQSTQATDGLNFSPTADAYVREAYPDKNYGSRKILYVDNLSLTRSYLRFDVSGLATNAGQSVTLRVYANSPNKTGVTVSLVPDNNWDEDAITFNNAPAIGAEVNSVDKVNKGQWVELDVSSVITSDGTYTLAITTTSNRNTNLSSREADNNTPQLVVSGEVAPTVVQEEATATLITPIILTETPTKEAILTGVPTLPSPPTNTVTPEQIPSSTSPAVSTMVVSASQNQTYLPVADTYVNSSNPGTNYGGSTSLRVDGSPIVSSLLRFSLVGVNQQVLSQVQLQVYANSSSTKGIDVKSVANNTWGELTTTFSNAPAAGNTLFSTQKTTGGSWVVFDVTTYVTGEGTYSFNLLTPGTTAINFSSRESGSRSPKLILLFNGLSTPLATMVPTLAATSTRTNTTVPIITNTPTRTSTVQIGATNTSTPTRTNTPNPIVTNTPTRTNTLTPTRINTLTPTRSSTPTSVVTSTTAPTLNSDPVLVGAGDISTCSNNGDEATAKLIDGIAGTVFTTGDNAYESGSASEYTNCYNPTWGRFKSRTNPSPGNHEYNTSGAAGYYGYFGAAAGDPTKGYYSYNLGSWHIIVLNSEISTSSGSVQEKWLRQDLVANPTTCTLAYWHKPRFSSGSAHGSNSSMQPLWQALYDNHADVIVNGHEHNYERFAPQSPSGVADVNGLREFVAGMGGRSHYGFVTILANSVARNSDTYGVLKFTLHSTSYDWQFVPEAGKTYADSGTALCVP